MRRPLTYFSMTKCVFIGLLGGSFVSHLYRKRQTNNPGTELGVYCRLGVVPHLEDLIKQLLSVVPEVRVVEKAQITCTDDGDDVVFFEGGLLITKLFYKSLKQYH